MTLAYGVLRDGGVCARVDGRVVDLRGVNPVFDAASLNALMEAGPVAAHQGPETFAEMTQALAGLELEELTERLRADAVGRSAGTLRDDLVVLAIRPRATSLGDESQRELAVSA